MPRTVNTGLVRCSSWSPSPSSVGSRWSISPSLCSSAYSWARTRRCSWPPRWPSCSKTGPAGWAPAWAAPARPARATTPPNNHRRGPSRQPHRRRAPQPDSQPAHLPAGAPRNRSRADPPVTMSTAGARRSSGVRCRQVRARPLALMPLPLVLNLTGVVGPATRPDHRLGEMNLPVVAVLTGAAAAGPEAVPLLAQAAYGVLSIRRGEIRSWAGSPAWRPALATSVKASRGRSPPQIPTPTCVMPVGPSPVGLLPVGLLRLRRRPLPSATAPSAHSLARTVIAAPRGRLQTLLSVWRISCPLFVDSDCRGGRGQRRLHRCDAAP